MAFLEHLHGSCWLAERGTEQVTRILSSGRAVLGPSGIKIARRTKYWPLVGLEIHIRTLFLAHTACFTIHGPLGCERVTFRLNAHI